MWFTPSVLTSAFFRQKSEAFVISRNTNINCIVKHFLILLTCFESLRVVLMNMVAILTMSAKLATPVSLAQIQ